MRKLTKYMLAGAAIAASCAAALAGGDWPGVPLAGGGPLWQTSTTYAQGAFVQANGNTYQMSAPGAAGLTCTSASSGSGPSGTGGVTNNANGIADGTCIWQYISPAYAATWPLTGNELFPADTTLAQGQQPQTELVSAAQIQGLAASGPSLLNAIIGGVSDSNLFQRCSTTQTAVTTTYTYGCADRWAIWAANDSIKLLKDTTAGDITTGYNSMYKFSRTTNNGGGQNCMGQVIESTLVYPFQGQTAELDFHLYTGATYPATTGALTAYIVTGTSADEGFQKFAYTVNAGGGGSTAWTGGVIQNAAVVPTSVQTVSTASRLAAFANIPTNAKEIGVAICWTSPNATAGANDYIAVNGIQLIRTNAALKSYANNSVVYVSGNASSPQMTSIQRRLPSDEALAEERYLYVIPESGTTGVVNGSYGFYDTTTTCTIGFQLPAVMRTTPTILTTVPGGLYSALGTGTFKVVPTSVTPVALATPFASIGTGEATPSFAAVSFKTTTETQYIACGLESVAGSGAFAFNAEE